MVCGFGELLGLWGVATGFVSSTKKFFSDAKYYVWEEPLLYKLCGDGVYRRYFPEDEIQSVLHHCHSSTYGGHFGVEKTIAKVF